ncbi:MAG: putative glycoside hydrolase [Acidobacteriota bacterium]
MSFALLPASGFAAACHGRVTDAVSGQPISGAIVTAGSIVVRTDGSGAFQFPGSAGTLGVRADGYLRTGIPASDCASSEPEVKLTPFRPKALYLSFYAIGTRSLRHKALRLVHQTELNALVIDVKSDRGFVGFHSAVPLAKEDGAQKVITIPNLKARVKKLHQQGLYLIARIVTFKDNQLASARPDLAVKTDKGKLWRDTEGMAWTDPFESVVRNYNIDIAVEAAQAGFDEIQFDYVRFPDNQGVVFSQKDTEDARVNTIAGFLGEARKRLAPYNVFLSADIFGYVCWNRNDTGIGQKLDEVLKEVDYVSPMLYPSTFRFGIPGYRNPVADPYDIIRMTLDRALERTGVDPVRFRPWLQAFRDYAFDHREFSATQIRDQIRAAEHFGSDGWMLWNPRNIYTTAGLKLREPQQQAKGENPPPVQVSSASSTSKNSK